MAKDSIVVTKGAKGPAVRPLTAFAPPAGDAAANAARSGTKLRDSMMVFCHHCQWEGVSGTSVEGPGSPFEVLGVEARVFLHEFLATFSPEPFTAAISCEAPGVNDITIHVSTCFNAQYGANSACKSRFLKWMSVSEPQKMIETWNPHQIYFVWIW